MNDYKDFTPEERKRMFEGVVTNYGVLYTPAGEGVESNRKVRICKVMPVEQFYEYCQQARSQEQCTGTVVNLFADHVLRETIQRLKAEGLYKQEVKKICNELQGIVLSWKTDMKELLGERYEAMEDIAIDRQSEIYGDFETLRMQVKQYFLKQKNKHAETASWVEMTQQMFVLSHMVIKTIVQMWYNENGIDFSDVFGHMDLLFKCSKKWQKVCLRLYSYEQQVEIIQKDKNFENAMKIFALQICELDGLYKHFQTALEEHADVFDDDDRKRVSADIEAINAKHEEERKEAEKANADYWAKTKRTAKPRASDITTEDLQQLMEHFNA